MLKGPVKYLVAKLHGCYSGANSLPVSQNFFARFFPRRPSPIQVAVNFFTSLQQTQKTLFAFLLMFFFTVTTREWYLYFLNLAVLLENFIHVRTYYNRKPQRWLYVDGEISKRRQHTISSDRLGIEISKMRRHKLKVVLRYNHLRTLRPRPF